jgi:hypothetical protein
MDGSSMVDVYFEHENGSHVTWHFRADALYSLVRDGELPSGIRTVLHVDFPYPANSRWVPPGRREDISHAEMARILCSLVKPFTIDA